MTAFKRPLLVYLLVYAAALLMVFAALWFAFIKFGQGPWPPKNAPAPYVPITQNDLYAPYDHARFFQIGTNLQEKRPISDDDLTYAIALLHQGPVKKTPQTHHRFLSYTLAQFFNRGSLTKKQQHRLAEVLAPYTNDPPPAERAPVDGLTAVSVSVQDIAVIALATLDDRAATAKLKYLSEHSATLKIRQTAGGGLLRQQKRRKQAAE